MLRAAATTSMHADADSRPACMHMSLQLTHGVACHIWLFVDLALRLIHACLQAFGMQATCLQAVARALACVMCLSASCDWSSYAVQEDCTAHTGRLLAKAMTQSLCLCMVLLLVVSQSIFTLRRLPLQQLQAACLLHALNSRLQHARGHGPAWAASVPVSHPSPQDWDHLCMTHQVGLQHLRSGN